MKALKLIGLAVAGLFLLLIVIGIFAPAPEEPATTKLSEGKRLLPNGVFEPKPAPRPAEQPREQSKAIRKSEWLSPGDTGRIDGGSGNVIMGTTKDNYDEVFGFLRAGDKAGMLQMIVAGRAFMVPDGTNALVIQSGFGTKRVRVQSGEHAGRDGWTVTEWVKR